MMKSQITSLAILIAIVAKICAQPLSVSTLAEFGEPTGVAVDAAGNVYVVDREYAAIQKITLVGTKWEKSTIAGSAPGGAIEFGSADGTNYAAQFFWPYGVAVDSSGTLYISDGGDGGNQTIRRITHTGTNWVVTTLAGRAHVSGATDGVGSAALFDNPSGIAVDSQGNVFVVDKESFIIRKVTQGGVVTTFAGKAYASGDADGAGSSARFFLPIGLSIDSNNNLFICDTGNNAIRKITPAALVSTVGTFFGTGINSEQWFPIGIAVDKQGSIFVADYFNYVLRKMKPNGTATTVAGLPGQMGREDGVGSAARFLSLEGLAVDLAGNLYVADAGGPVRKCVAYNGPPVLAIQPQRTNTYVGSNVLFTVTVYGYTSSELTGVTYQWQRKPAALQAWTDLISGGTYLGATNSSLTVRFLTTEMSGDVFRCVVTAPIGSTTSQSAVLIVESLITPPSVTIEPAEQTAAVGARVTFTAVATGTPPLQFQWRKNGSEIPGATGADLVFEAVSPNDAGVYVVAVSNASGFVALAHATLTITTSTVLPMINAQPNDRTVDEGADVEFLVVATGTLPLAHQWERQAAGAASWSNLSDGAVYSGTASSSLSIVHVVASMNGDQFRCVVTNMSGTVTSGVATLTVISPNQPPSITTQPVGQYATIGSSVSFSVTASGIQPLGYQWEKDGADISGATGPIFNIASVQTSSAGAYRVRVSNNSGTNSSDIATLTVVNEAYVQPVTKNISGAFSNEASGQIADSIVVSQPFEVVHATWYGYHQTELSPAVSAIPFRLRFFQDESGKPNATPVFDQAVNASVQSTGQRMNTPSDFYNGRVLFRYEADLNPGFSIPAGVTVWFSIVNRTDVYYWLWARSSFLPNELAYRGANDPWQTAQDGQMAFSLYAPLAAPTETAPKITIQPQSQTVNAGQDVTFCIVATGTAPLSYSWRKNGAPIPGATNVCLLIANVQATDAGLYSVEVRNTAGIALSVEAKLQVTGTVVAWGWNNHGQTNVPAGLSSVIAIAAGGYHSVALKTDRTVVAWGAGKTNTGSIQDIDYGQSIIPPGLSGVRAIAAGVTHTVALKSDGTVVAWGANFFGETNVPAGLTGVTAIAAGGNSSAALKGDGTVVAWGSSSSGQRNLPAGLNGVTAIAVGGYHTVALKGDGTVVAWGDNGQGQTNVPAGLTGVTAIAASGLYTVALKSDGTVVAWGGNDSGQTNVPAGLTGVVAVAAGWRHIAALKADGTLVAWGRNVEGQTTLPAGLSGVNAIAGGYAHTLALVGANSDQPPCIAVQSASGHLILSWPETAAGFRIQSTFDVALPISWSSVIGALETNSGSVSISVPMAEPQKFYRLLKP